MTSKTDPVIRLSVAKIALAGVLASDYLMERLSTKLEQSDRMDDFPREVTNLSLKLADLLIDQIIEESRPESEPSFPTVPIGTV